MRSPAKIDFFFQISHDPELLIDKLTSIEKKTI